ncbi:MAG: hypothetical protein LAT81_16710 [Oceanicaulis sp.]|nr:hypothetical protein [Oceanicaulis sp.]
MVVQKISKYDPKDYGDHLRSALADCDGLKELETEINAYFSLEVKNDTEAKAVDSGHRLFLVEDDDDEGDEQMNISE